MDMLTYLRQMQKAERAAFAKRCGTSLGHLQNIAYGYKPCKPDLAMAIEEESGRTILAETIAPGYRWHVIRGTKAA